MKLQDISIILAEYVKAKLEYQAAEREFDESDINTVDGAMTRYEKAEEHMAAIACTIVDSLIEGM